MSDKKITNVYDDDDIPPIDLPQDKEQNTNNVKNSTEPLPESSRPRKDGPGGE